MGRSFSLSSYVFWALFVPIALMIAILSGLLLVRELRTLDDALDTHAGTHARSLAVSLGAEPLERWQASLTAALRDPHMRSAHVLDAGTRVILAAGPEPLHRPDRLATTDISAQPGSALQVIEAIPGAAPEAWILAEYSRLPTQIAQHQAILLYIGQVLLLLAASAVLAVLFERRLRTALAQIKANLSRADGEALLPLKGQAPLEYHRLNQAVIDTERRVRESTRELRQSMEQSNADLRETLETVEIQNIELAMARKEALRASQAKTRFLADTSHEIRTPLTGILGSTRLLARTPLTEGQREYVAGITRWSEELMHIIDAILDYSKIEADKLVLDHIRFNLRDLVEETMFLLAASALDKRVELVLLVYQDVPPEVVGDPLRLKQVLTNLLGNAIKFTPSGSIVVRVMLEDQQDSSVVLRIAVTDTGIGIDSDQQQRIFEAFEQAIPPSLGQNHGGTGLGLVIAKRLIEQMDGELTLESAPGTGSTFSFTLALSSCAPSAPQANNWITRPGPRVLVYDPLPIAAQATAHLFSAIGLQPELLEDWSELVAQVSTSAPDLVALGLDIGATPAEAQDSISEVQRCFSGPLLVLRNQTTDLRLTTNDTATRVEVVEKPVRKGHLEAACSAVLSAPAAVASGAQEEYATDFQHARVLVVDDNDDNSRMLAAMVRDRGAQVDTAGGGLEALALIGQRRYDLVFMDVQMPGITGLEAASMVRGREQPPAHLPIVAVSAHILDEERRALLAGGIDECLTKPVTDTVLLACLRRWVPAAPEGGTSPYSPASATAELRSEIRGRLLKDLAEVRARLLACCASNDRTGALTEVHNLNGAAAYCQLPELHQAAADCESTLKVEPHSDLRELLAPLLEAIAAAAIHPPDTDGAQSAAVQA